MNSAGPSMVVPCVVDVRILALFNPFTSYEMLSGYWKMMITTVANSILRLDDSDVDATP
jgi:hypothetical protein